MRVLLLLSLLVAALSVLLGVLLMLLEPLVEVSVLDEPVAAVPELVEVDDESDVPAVPCLGVAIVSVLLVCARA
ncbi:MAG TPA: hypothetical protein VJ608_06965 [Albitalea sp.]|nr:hypothetical protein [Albitalea sp.]